MNKQEDFQNRALAHLLTEQGVPADFEQRAGHRRMDVVADVEGLRVVLEAETGFHRKAQAIKDADARLRQRLATVVFAVCYPDGVTESNLAEATLTWTVRVKAGEPSGEWSTGGVTQLAQAVQQAPRSLSGADVAARILSDGLDEVVAGLKTPVRRALARALDLPATKPKRGERSDSYFVAAKRGMLVVATAMLFHHRVQSYLPDEPPDGYDGDWPPASATTCAEQEAVINAYREAWRGILAVDYRPVFETGRAALAAISADPDTAQAVRRLSEVVARVSERVTGLRHDLLGRIFHRVLDTARYDGSFYTSTAAAVLLASLALREQDANWSDPNAVAALRICDPACGTGTLLMAAAERIRDLRNAAGPGDPEDEEALGLALVEDVLWGYDVNLTATHMAASTLGMLSPTTRFSRMNIHRALLGVFDGVPYLGSLDFLSGQARLAAWPSAAQQVDTERGMAEPPPPMDLVIMNPPFTRDSLRHDQFTREDELAVKNREKAVLGGLSRQDNVLLNSSGGDLVIAESEQAAARLHSSGGAFTVLTEKLLKPHAGALALVLPSVVPTAPGNLALRKYLAQRFHIDTIVSSHDPSRIFFSENTSIGEVLLVCRRWSGSGPKPQTRVVNLARNPATPLEALDAAARIERSDGGGGGGLHRSAGGLQPYRARRLVRRQLPVAVPSGSLPDAQRDRSGGSPHSPVERSGRRRPGGAGDTRHLHALGHADPGGSAGALVSQDGHHAVDAGADRRLRRTQAFQAAPRRQILGAAQRAVAAAPSLASPGASRSGNAAGAGRRLDLDALPPPRPGHSQGRVPVPELHPRPAVPAGHARQPETVVPVLLAGHAAVPAAAQLRRAGQRRT